MLRMSENVMEKIIFYHRKNFDFFHHQNFGKKSLSYYVG